MSTNEAETGARQEASPSPSPEVGKADEDKKIELGATEEKSSEVSKEEEDSKAAPAASEEKVSKEGVETETAAGASEEKPSEVRKEEECTEVGAGSSKETPSDVSKEQVDNTAATGASKETPSDVSKEEGAKATASGTGRVSMSALARKNYKGKRNDMRIAEKLAAEKRQQKEKPWLKDGDTTYLEDAVDPDYVSRWPYKSYKCTIHLALPHIRKEPIFHEDYGRFVADEIDMKPENFRVKTIINPFHPEDWEEPEDDDDPLYVQVIVEGDIRNADLMDWNDKFKDAVCRMDDTYIPGNILVFFFGLHTKPLPTGSRRREIDEDDDDMYW